jgi:transposase
MTPADAEEFTQSLGQIVAGSWRQIALAKRLGVPKALGLTTEKWVSDRLGGYVKTSISERREAVKELTAEGLSQREIGEVLGVDPMTVNRDLRRVANATEGEEEINPVTGSDDDSVANATPLDAFATLAANEKIRTTAQATATRQANEDKRKADLDRIVNVPLVAGLQHGDFRELSDQIPDSSVQLIFTDPPYDSDAVQLYEDAARVARRILKSGGSFIAYSGQRHLPAVLLACSRHLDYWWTVAGVHGGGNQILNKLGIRCGWKPLVWFVKGTRGDVQNVLSDVVTGDREKAHHEWQQAEEEACYYIEKLTTEEGLLVDFFVGGGTTIAAAEKLGRKWIGFEIDASAAERASSRIAKAMAA